MRKVLSGILRRGKESYTCCRKEVRTIRDLRADKQYQRAGLAHLRLTRRYPLLLRTICSLTA
ncbi:MAG: hypothetical protein RI996_338 [Candidatus Parcubacteria bacterium]|jgi:hypothetical protein